MVQLINIGIGGKVITNKQAGVDCSNCGHKVVVETEDEKRALIDSLTWHHGDPECPECGYSCWFEDYLD